MNVSFLVLAQVLLLLVAIVYRIVSWSKKDDQAQKHYSILSEVYVAALIVMIGLGHQSKCMNPKEVVTIHDTIFTNGPLPDQPIPGINPKWNEIPEETNK
jgi:hypothetical protein